MRRSSWNAFHCKINSKQLLSVADAMDSSGACAGLGPRSLHCELSVCVPTLFNVQWHYSMFNNEKWFAHGVVRRHWCFCEQRTRLLRCSSPCEQLCSHCPWQARRPAAHAGAWSHRHWLGTAAAARCEAHEQQTHLHADAVSVQKYPRSTCSEGTFNVERLCV